MRTEPEVGPQKSNLHHFEWKGNPLSIWGSVILDQKLEFVADGDKVRVTYEGLGTASQGRNPPKHFKVEVDRT